MKNICLLVVLAFSPDIFAEWNFANSSSVFKLCGTDAKIILEQNIPNFSGTFLLTDGQTPSTFLQTTTDQALITCQNASIQTSRGKLDLAAGTINVDSSNNMKLYSGSGNTINISDKNCLPMYFSGPDNSLVGYADLTEKIFLQDSNTFLQVKILNQLNQNIVLNSGNLSLGGDLSLKDSVVFEGDGTIDLSNHMLLLCGAESLWSGNLAFLNATNFTFKSHINVGGTWTFSGNGNFSNISGFYNDLHFHSNGKIVVQNNHKLILSSLDIVGLSDSRNNIFEIDSTATLELKGVTIDLSEDATFSAGTIIFSSGNCNIISRNNSFLKISGTANLIIDGVVLHFDSFQNPGVCPIIVEQGGSISRLNQGDIAPGFASISIADIEISAPANIRENVIDCSLDLIAQRRIKFINENPSLRKTMIFNGSGNRISFFNTGKKSFVIDPNIDLYLKNLVLEGFDPNSFEIFGSADSKSKIYFDENVSLVLKKDIDLSNFTLNVSGSLNIEGNQHRIDLFDTSIKTSGNASLRFFNVNMNADQENIFANLSNQTTIKIASSTFSILESCPFSFGSITFEGKNRLIGTKTFMDGDIECPSELLFNSNGYLTIAANSSLIVDAGMILTYNPNVSTDTTLLQKRSHLQMASLSSKIELNSGVLKIGPNGLLIEQGTLNARGNAVFSMPAGNDAVLVIGTSADFNIGQEAQIIGKIEIL